MRDLKYQEAVLIGVWLETLTYGLYITLFFSCLWVLLIRNEEQQINWRLLGPAIALFVLSTLHVSVGLHRLIEGFTGPHNPATYFTDLRRWPNIFADSLYITINFIGDAIVIYRCFVIWDWDIRPVLLPMIMLVTSAVTGAYGIDGFRHIKPGSTAFNDRVFDFLRVEFVLSLAVNLLCTGLVVYRIAKASQVTAIVEGRTPRIQMYSDALAVVVESAALYTVSLAIYIGLYFSQSNAQYILYVTNAQIISIVPTLMLVRVGLGTKRSNGWEETQSEVQPHPYRLPKDGAHRETEGAASGEMAVEMDPLPASPSTTAAPDRRAVESQYGSKDSGAHSINRAGAAPQPATSISASASPTTTYRPTSGYSSSYHQPSSSHHHSSVPPNAPGPSMITQTYAPSSRSVPSGASPPPSLYAVNHGFGTGYGPNSSSSGISSNVQALHYPRNDEQGPATYPPPPSPVVIDPRWPALSSASRVMR
ncbi:hypothetical protein BOTBODRAFT_598854 [Botryobasidium botryosum FD-172 SS1]|uniref:Uncharacterized protein n=1 Tax=Botryobasidium botryosum (strain FD-172 SS1) TaxID=930990 RepID=A0A067MZ27_BOTB1|nr:hypothetical protein BOTBODRAFT_598854 [Botryobasidium botryosum FD-172 SS1]